MMAVCDVRATCKEEFKAGQSHDNKEIMELLEKVPKVGQIFTIINRIGEGTFSQVYAAKLKNRPEVNDVFALKHIVPTSHPSRIESELRCLKEIGGVDHVMGVHCCIRERDHVIVVMPYFRHDKFQTYLSSMTITEVREYMRALLSALRHVHSHGIAHRDVKPSNFLHDRKNKRYRLVDFGLAHKISQKALNVQSGLYNNTAVATETCNSDLGLQRLSSRVEPSAQVAATRKSPRRKLLSRRALLLDQTGRRRTQSASGGGPRSGACQCGVGNVCDVCMSRKAQNAPRAGTPGYRPPEILMKSPVQTCALDMWATGVVLLSLLSKRYPFFKAPDDMTSLAQIITVLGSEAVQKGAEALGKNLHCEPARPSMDLRKLCLSLRHGKDLTDPATKDIRETEFTVPDSAHDLLRGLLEPNPFTRWTAEKALEHEFFLEEA